MAQVHERGSIIFGETKAAVGLSVGGPLLDQRGFV